MTKEEYLRATAYASPEEAKKDLSFIRVLFPLAFVLILFSNIGSTLVSLGYEVLGVFILFGYLGFLVFFVLRCREIIEKTKKVTKAQLFFSIILAPVSWIWFYPQLSEPLEIIVGSRMPPTTDVAGEQQARAKARKTGANNAVRTILIVAGIVFLFLVAMLIYQAAAQDIAIY